MEDGRRESSPFEDRDSRFHIGQAERQDKGRESNNDAMICNKEDTVSSTFVYTSAFNPYFKLYPLQLRGK
jgi:hypothetical protein